MRQSRLSIFTALASLAMLLWLSPERATAGLVVALDDTSHVFSGTTPGGAETWAEAIFTRLGDHKVEVRFTIPTGAVPGLYLDDAAFQLNTSTAPVFTHVSGITASSASFKAAGIAVPGTGNEKFDANFGFPNAANNRVTFGKDSVYDITFSSGMPILAADLSNLFRTPDASGHGYFAAAHLAGYNRTSVGLAGHIGSVSDSPSHVASVGSVPEPSSLVAFGLGMSGLVLAYAVRCRRARLGPARVSARQG